MKNFNLKKFLKTVKLNEEAISMVLGALVIVIVGILVVNYFKDRKNPDIDGALSTETPSASDTAKVGKEHTVKEGETLWSIAEDAYGSGYNWVDIYNKNKLSSQNVTVGQKLEIPDVSAKEPTVTNADKTLATTKPELVLPTNSPAPEPAVTTGNLTTADKYTVVRGDNLWEISVRAYGDGYKWVEIAKANKLKNPDIIHAGNVLILPR